MQEENTRRRRSGFRIARFRQAWRKLAHFIAPPLKMRPASPGFVVADSVSRVSARRGESLLAPSLLLSKCDPRCWARILFFWGDHWLRRDRVHAASCTALRQQNRRGECKRKEGAPPQRSRRLGGRVRRGAALVKAPLWRRFSLHPFSFAGERERMAPRGDGQDAVCAGLFSPRRDGGRGIKILLARCAPLRMTKKGAAHGICRFSASSAPVCAPGHLPFRGKGLVRRCLQSALRSGARPAGKKTAPRRAGARCITVPLPETASGGRFPDSRRAFPGCSPPRSGRSP